MKLSFRHIILSALLVSSLGLARALDLPVKRVNGHDYYFYEVKRGETLLQIAEKLNIPRESILRYNPAAADGLRPGTNLYLPVEKFADDNKKNAGVSDDGSMLRYKVERGETLYGIAYRFGITPSRIIELNPKADYGVKAGDILLLPACGDVKALTNLSETGASATPSVQQSQPTSVSEEIAQGIEQDNTRQSAVVKPQAVQEDSADEVAPDYMLEERRLRPVVAPTAFLPQEVDTPVVVVLAPLDAENESQAKHSRNALDFVRGFLMGLDAESAGAYPVDVKILDTQGSDEQIASLLKMPREKDIDVVIAPDETGGLAATLADVRGKECYVLNLFAAQDTSYLVNPQSVQTYIPTALMYEKACEALVEAYGDHTPVFLIAKGGRTEKLPFTNYLREYFAASGMETEDVVFDGMLTSDELSALSHDEKYVFIPSSGAHSEFTKFARALINFRNEFVNPSDVALFGYPDWTAFIDESLDNLHELEATVYTRFYNNSKSVASREFYDEFEQLYGVRPLEQLPSQAMLGYDAARYILTNLKDNSNEFTPEDNKPYSGLQSTFMFRPSDQEDMSDEERTTGPVNQALYIVTYRRGDAVSVEVM